LDAIVELKGVFGHDSIDDDRWIEIELSIQAESVFNARSYEIVHEVHFAAGFEPVVVEVYVVAFDYDIRL